VTRTKLLGCLAILSIVLSPATGIAESEQSSSVQGLLVILKDRNVIDESEYARLATKNATYEAEQQQRKLPTLAFWGDFRARYEGFWFDQDELGNNRSNRERLRYRFRVNGKAEVADRAIVAFRLTSGSKDPRSTNQTLGGGVDFDTDDLRLDQAYARISPFKHEKLPNGSGRFAVEFGKMPNHYRWKNGKDYFWDGDYSLEGAQAVLSMEAGEGVDVFATGGYYVIDEESTHKDPHLWAFQAGTHVELTDTLTVGGRATYYHFDSLDDEFSRRGALCNTSTLSDPTPCGGNIREGLTGGIDDQDLQVVETAGYLKWTGIGGWPVLLYGDFMKNLTAESARGAGREDTAWGAGAEVGDKKKWVKLGVGYWHIEANAFPSQFIDSDLHDGFTNRQGWVFYGSRSLFQNTDFNLTAFLSDEIENDVPPFGASVPNAERVRVQADVVLKFK